VSSWAVRFASVSVTRFGDDFVLARSAHFVMELEFATRQTCFVFHTQVVVLKLNRFSKCNFVLW